MLLGNCCLYGRGLRQRWKQHPVTTVGVSNSYHDGNVVPLLVHIGWRFHLVERLAHGVQQQFVLGQVLPRFHYQVDELQSIALALCLTPLPSTTATEHTPIWTTRRWDFDAGRRRGRLRHHELEPRCDLGLWPPESNQVIRYDTVD